MSRPSAKQADKARAASHLDEPGLPETKRLETPCAQAD